MNKSTRIPSLEEFKNTCRKEFDFLIRDFGFEEQKLSADDKNQFKIIFSRSDLQVMIEGQSYGSVAYMYLKNASGRGILADYLDPQFQPFAERKYDGQIEDIKKASILLRQHGMKLLDGDNSVFENIF